MLIPMVPRFCGLLQTILCTSIASCPSPTTRDAPQTQNSSGNAQRMSPKPKPSGFVPPHLLREITKSEACSPESQRAAADTLRHGESRAMTPKSSQNRQDMRGRGATPSTDGYGESGKSDDGMDGQSGGASGTATSAGGENPFKKATEKPKESGAN
ncbi:hypothetical protein VUR80DRAFT_7686 [Thermomyces stellatus]